MMPLVITTILRFPETSLLLLQGGLALTVEWKLGRKLPKPVPSIEAMGPSHRQPLPSPCLPSSSWHSPCLCVLLLGTDPEETILHAFKVFDTEGKGFVKADL